MSRIEWTDETWNPTTGCDKVSPGCDHCYAERMATRLAGRFGYPADEPFRLTVHEDRITEPNHWRKPRRVFVNSMSDLFHPDVPPQLLLRVFNVMGNNERHTFQVLTKRPQWMRKFVDFYNDESRRITDLLQLESVVPLSNVWLGTSIENDRYTFRADHLRETPAAVRFLSLEPLLGPLPSLDLTGIDWVIVGGESGPGARPMHPHWAREIRDRCVDAGVAFFFKQWGAWGHPAEVSEWAREGAYLHIDGSTHEYPGGWHCRWSDDKPRRIELDPDTICLPVVRLGKRAAGRTLDGRTWDEMPERVAVPV